MAWNTAVNRQAMRSFGYVQYTDALRKATNNAERIEAFETYMTVCDEVSNLALPELVILTWEECSVLFGGEMYPNSGIYMEPHLHRHDVCYCLGECPWAFQSQPCQAYEHWEKRCDKHYDTWWEKYGKAENEEYLRNNPPSHECRETDLEFKGVIGAPGVGQSWKCRSCGAPWQNIGGQFFRPDETEPRELNEADVR